MKWLARIVAFALAFLLGAWIAGLFGPSACMDVPAPAPVAIVRSLDVPAVAPVSIEDLVGTWPGTWGYDREPSTIEISRIKGEKFYGTLRKAGAVITLVGTLDPTTRTVSIRETKVVRLGPEMNEWSLGTNEGSFSADGRTLSGTGRDKWGEYGWDASKDPVGR